MTAPLTHEQAVELLGAYALDAVDDDEREAVGDHLRDCPRCRAEVEQHREVAAHLAFAGASAPAGLWGKIAAELSPGRPGPELAPIYPLAADGRRPRRMVAALTAAAAVILVAVGLLGWQLHDQQRQVGALRRAVAGAPLSAQVARVSLDPASARFRLTSADGAVHVNVVVAADGTGYVVSNGTLKALPGGETYQLWGVIGGQKVSLGLLGDNPGVVQFPAATGRMTAMAITAEQAGGVVVSQHTPVAVGSATTTE